jgi:PPOX class probable F420-dependent enzyme
MTPAVTQTDLDRLRRLVGGDHGLATVATRRTDGTVQASVVNAGLVDHPVTGAPVAAFVARGNARKLVHLRRSPRAIVLWRVGWTWASVEGPVELAGPDDRLAGLEPSRIPGLLRAVFQGAGGTHDDWPTFDRVMAEERRCAVLLAPERVAGVA